MPDMQLDKKLSQVTAYQQALDANSILSITDTDGVITYVNDHFCALSQYSTSELIGKTHRIISAHYHGRAFFTLMYDTISAGKVWRGDVKNRARDGRTYWVDMTIVPLKNEMGIIEGYVAIDYDITDRKLVKERRFQLLFDNSKDGMLMARPDGAFSEVNDAFCQMLGYSREELLKMRREDITVSDDKNLTDGLKKRIATGHYEGMLKFKRKDGSIMEANISTAIYEDDNGEKRSYVCMRDMTEKVKAEEQLYKNKNRLRSMIKHGRDVITLISADGTIKYRSPSYKTVFGYDPDTMGDDLVFGNLHPDDQETIKELMAELIKKPGGSVESKWRQRHANGNYMYIEGSGTNMLDDPEMEAIVLNCRDITEHINIKEQLERSNTELNRLFNTIDEVVYTVDTASYQLTQMSEAAIKVYGYPAADFLADSQLWFKLIIPEDRHVPAEIDVHLKLGETATRQYRITHRDGSIKWIEATWVPTLDETGKLIRMDGVNRDITERKQAEKEKSDYERRFRALIENSKDAIALTDPDRKILYMSPSVKQILGYEPEELIGKTSYDIFMDPSEVGENLAFRQSLQPGQTASRTIKAKHKSGAWRWIESEATNYLDDPAIGAILTNFRDVTEKQGAEEALLLSEKRFRALIENSKDVIAMADSNRTIIYISPSIRDILGYEADELIGTDSSLLMHPEETLYNLAVRKQLGPGETMTLMMRAHHKNGSWRWLEVTITNQLEDLSIGAIVSNIRDVTEKKGAEDALVNSEKKFRALIENNKDGIALTDSNREFIYLSPSMTDILGYAPQALIGTAATDLYHPDDLMEMEKKVSPFILHRQDHLSGLVRIRHKSGEWRWVELTSSNKLDDPAINAIVTNYRDVTARKNAEEAVLNSERRFRALIENNKEGIALSDRNRKFTYISPSVKNILGYESEELTGMNAKELYHPDDQQSMRDMVRNIVDNKMAFGSNTVRIRHKDNTWRWIELTATYQFDDPAVNAMVTNFRDVTDKKRSDEILSNNEKKFRALVENGKDGIALLDKNMTLTYLSPSVRNITGFEPEELLASNTLMVSHPDDVAEVSEKLTALIEGRSKYVHMQVRCAHRDGGWRWIESIVTNQLDDPAVNAIVSNFRDVTEKKNAEEALSNSEKKFRTLIENNKEGISLTDDSSLFVYLSPSAIDILGLSPEELLGTSAFDRYHPEDQPVMKKIAASIRTQNGNHANACVRVLHKDGTWRWIELTATNQLHDPAINAIVTNFRDVTEKKKSEQSVIDSEKKFRALIENGKDGIALTGPDRHFTYLSPQVKTMLGYDPEDLTGSHPLAMYHPDDREKIYKFVESITDKKVPHTIEDLRIICKDGSTIWAELTFCDQFDDPAINALVCNFRDVTARRKAEEELEMLNQSLERKIEERTAQLQESNKALESFSYMAAHDLQAPLRVLSGYASILKNEYRANLNEDGSNLLDTMVLKTKHMSKLISDMLTFSRASHAAMREEQVNLDEMVRGIADQISLSTGTIATIKINILPLGSHTCDAGLIQQVWINLISNAVKYSGKKEKPVIEIGAIKGESETVYYVKDNGAGFDMRYASNLFEVFKRMHSADEFEGTGIGLALVKSVITRHRGRVWAEAEPDKGATFFFALPDADAE